MMDKSDSIAKIASAIAKAQAEMENAAKDTKNPFFKSTYADLKSVTGVIKAATSKNGLSFIQVCHESENGVKVETVILHESGEFISCGVLSVPAAKQDPQGYGSALTYARRYSLSAAFGVAPEDDDGNAATKAIQDKELDKAAEDKQKLFEEEKNKAHENEAAILEGVFAKIGMLDNIPHLDNYEKVLRGTTTAKNAVSHEHYNLFAKLNPGDKKALETRISARREIIRDSLPKGVDTAAMFDLAGKKAITKEEIRSQLKEAYNHDDLTHITVDEMDAIMTWLGGLPDAV